MGSNDVSKAPFHIAVVGGGIGGLCITIGLLHQNVSVTLYEAASAFAEIGAGVSFGPNALQAMALLDPEIQSGYEKIETRNGWPSKRQHWFDFRVGDKKVPGGVVGETIAEVLASGVGKSSVHRAHFLDCLVQMIPDGVALFGKRLENLESIKGEKMKMKFADGTTAEADAVIGCDGIKSRSRQILLGEKHEAANARFSGNYAYRGLIPMEKAAAAIGDELARNGQMYMGNRAHVLTFPIEKGNTMNVVAFQTKEDGKWEDERWVLPMQKEHMFKDFEEWGETVQKILSVSANGTSPKLYVDLRIAAHGEA
jgi:salicylate hydroxylase